MRENWLMDIRYLAKVLFHGYINIIFTIEILR